MARTAIAICWGLVALAFAVSAVGQVRVRGYVRKDGTYVAPHYRSSPNSTKSDNYSTRGNYNPYTGKPGNAPADSGFFYAPRSYAPPVVPSVAPIYPPASTQEVIFYQCTDGEGVVRYIDYPRAGCNEVTTPTEIQTSGLQHTQLPNSQMHENATGHEEYPSSQRVSVVDVRLGSHVSSNFVIPVPKTIFRPDESIHLAIHTRLQVGAEVGATLGVLWTYGEGEDLQAVSDDSKELFFDGDGITVFEISKPDNWPEGKYNAEIFIDGESVKNVSFIVR